MSAKVSLRDYQRNLSARLANFEAGQAASKLGLQIGNARWLVDLADAKEVIPVPPIMPVPLTRTWFSGIANIRGNLYSVVDFAAFLYATPTLVVGETRLLLIGDRHRTNAGLLVSRVLGLHRNDELELTASPSAAWTSAEYRDAHDNKWQHLNVSQLVTHPDFLHVGG